MFMDFRRDYNDGLVHIYDAQLLKEMKQYTNEDVIESRLNFVTRHFDLLTAACIGWAMKTEIKQMRQAVVQQWEI